MLSKHDFEILRPLVARYAEIAALPVQEEKRRLWLDHNSHRSARPMVLIDQVCWSEMDVDGSLKCGCQDPYWRNVENQLRQKLYSWAHMPVDMVFNPYLDLPKPLINTGWGITPREERLDTDNPDVSSHNYQGVLEDMEDVQKIRIPRISLDVEKDRLIRQEADILCQGLIPYQMLGMSMHLGIWDRISEWVGVENCYIDLIVDPDFLHALMERMTQGLLQMIEDLNRIGGYDVTGNITHCSHTFSEDLPKKGSDPDFGTTENGWAFGLAQLFTACSPEVTQEFEVPYMNRVFPHFGAVYYGCCERLDDRLDVIAKLKNIRKISCSPWSHKEAFAEKMPDWCIMSNKPNPAILAALPFEEDMVRKDLRQTIDAARRYGRNLEMIQKDISTVRGDPRRLWRWAEIAMEEAQR